MRTASSFVIAIILALAWTSGYGQTHVYGANINRRTVEELQVAGFRAADVAVTDLWRDIFKKIVINNRK